MLTTLKKEQFDELFTLITEAFPEDEHRGYDAQRALLDDPRYRVFTYEKDGEIGAFFATWEGPDFIFVEHFAVKESFRNGGLGSTLLQAFLQQHEKPVILEIEPPESGIEKRRAGFYVRNGFHLTDWGYTQPPFSEGRSPVPLVLMSYPKALSEQAFQSFKTWMFTHLYTSN